MRVVECQYLSSDLCFMMNLTGGEGGMSGERGNEWGEGGMSGKRGE